MDPRVSPETLSRTLEEAAQHFYHGNEDLDQVLERLTVLATQVIPDCDLASVTLRDNGRVVTVAATAELAQDLDELQHQHGEGPCLDAAGEEHWTYTPSLLDDQRWPRFSRAAAEQFEMGSLLACQLARIDQPENRTGALNLYSRRPEAFSETDGMLGLLIGAFAGVLVTAARQSKQLTQALQSRDVIGQAKGILMAHQGITEEEAFNQLVEVSQQFNVKLREVAKRLADESDEGLQR